MINNRIWICELNSGDKRESFLRRKPFQRMIIFFIVLPIVIGFISEDALSESLINSEKDHKEPTCVDSGYIALEERGTIRIEELPPTGHQFSDWIIDSEAKTRTHLCQKCGYKETIRISSIAEELLPRLEMTGSMDGIGRKSRVILNIKYTDPEQTFQCYGLCTLQGHSTFGLPKKNYTIRFYDDAEGTKKHKVSFRNWHSEHKYILKANYIDVSQCRNIVGAWIWTSIVKTRKTIPERLSALPTYGAVDGFPVAVYFNGDFFGLYTLNLHKDDDLYQMKKNKLEAVVICNEQRTDESLFRSKAAFLPNNESDWEIEFSGTDDETWVKDSFNELISFIMESDDLSFRKTLNEYLDLDAAIDYLIYIYALGLEDSGAKDLVMLSYGKQWIPSAYDMDEAFGLDALDLVYRKPEDFLPQLVDTYWDSGTGSLLWDRILNSFTEQLKDRYFELRNGPLSEENLIKTMRTYCSQIPESFYDYDWYLFPGRDEQFMYMDQQIGNYIPARLKILDGLFNGGENP